MTSYGSNLETANAHKISTYKTQTSSHGDAMVDAIERLSELDDNQDWYSLMCNPNNSAIKNPECDTVNFYFVRHAEPQCYYPAGDRVFWSANNITNKQRPHDDGITGFGKRIARNTGKGILRKMNSKENRTVMILTGPMSRCVETAIEIHKVIKESDSKIRVMSLNIEKGLTKHLNPKWFSEVLKDTGGSSISDLFLKAKDFEDLISSKEKIDGWIQDCSILPTNYKLEFENKGKINDMLFF